MTAINKLLSKAADGKRVVYVDFTEAFVTTNGRLPKELMPDLLHPNALGYEKYAAVLEPQVKALLKK